MQIDYRTAKLEKQQRKSMPKERLYESIFLLSHWISMPQGAPSETREVIQNCDSDFKLFWDVTE